MRWEMFRVKALWELSLALEEIKSHPGRLSLIVAIAVTVGFATYIAHRPEALPSGPQKIYITVSGTPRMVPKPTTGPGGPVVPAPTRRTRSVHPTDTGGPSRGKEPTQAPTSGPTPTLRPSPTPTGGGSPSATPSGTPTGGGTAGPTTPAN